MGQTPGILVHVAGRVEICDAAVCVVTAGAAKDGHGRGVVIFGWETILDRQREVGVLIPQKPRMRHYVVSYSVVRQLVWKWDENTLAAVSNVWINSSSPISLLSSSPLHPVL